MPKDFPQYPDTAEQAITQWERYLQVVANSYPNHLREDLLQEARLGVLLAFRDYEPERGYWSIYCISRIKGQFYSAGLKELSPYNIASHIGKAVIHVKKLLSIYAEDDNPEDLVRQEIRPEDSDKARAIKAKLGNLARHSKNTYLEMTDKALEALDETYHPNTGIPGNTYTDATEPYYEMQAPMSHCLPKGLTERELTIIEMLTQGYSAQDVATALHAIDTEGTKTRQGLGEEVRAIKAAITALTNGEPRRPPAQRRPPPVTYTHQGLTLTLKEWGARLKTKPGTLSCRLKKYPIEEAFQPNFPRRKK